MLDLLIVYRQTRGLRGYVVTPRMVRGPPMTAWLKAISNVRVILFKYNHMQRTHVNNAIPFNSQTRNGGVSARLLTSRQGMQQRTLRSGRCEHLIKRVSFMYGYMLTVWLHLLEYHYNKDCKPVVFTTKTKVRGGQKLFIRYASDPEKMFVLLRSHTYIICTLSQTSGFDYVLLSLVVSWLALQFPSYDMWSGFRCSCGKCKGASEATRPFPGPTA